MINNNSIHEKNDSDLNQAKTIFSFTFQESKSVLSMDEKCSFHQVANYTKVKTKFTLALIVFLLHSLGVHAQITADILVVSGGGSGSSYYGGGGGGGAVRYWSNQTLGAGLVAVTVGAGGAAVSTTSSPINGQPGQSSSFGASYVATSSSTANGGNNGGGGGGSGGGGSGDFGSAGNGGTAVSGMGGFNGGNGVSGSAWQEIAGGGGGGAAGSGYNAFKDIAFSNHGAGGDGGPGIGYYITGTITYYGGGGGGGIIDVSSANPGSGGIGGGGAGSRAPNTATSGTPNTGGGGGGVGGDSWVPGTSGAGGSGVVIVRYASATPLASGGTITSYVGNGTNGTNGVTYQVHTFNSSGTFSLFFTTINYIVVGGGGGAGAASAFQAGGGGGSGGVVETGSFDMSSYSSSYSITIGSGGSFQSNGSNSVLSGTGITTITANGGSAGTDASGTTSGNGGTNGTAYGAGGNGMDFGVANSQDGGDGLLINSTGTYYGGGGGGGNYNGSPGGFGNYGQGTNGRGARGQNANAGGVGVYGTANPGVVVLIYASNSPLATGGTITSFVGNGTNGVNGVTYQVHTFTTDGTFAYITSLPTSWLSMGCSKIGGQKNVVQWTSVGEKENDSFVVERSADGIHFNRVGAITVAVSSTEPVYHSFTDENTLMARAYYRITHIEQDGNSSRSEICAVMPTHGERAEIQVYPNPAVDVLHISNAAADGELLNIKLFDMAGKEVLTVRSAEKNIDIATTYLKSGLYMISVEGAEGMRIQQKVMICK